jgi:Family of unknown function (DUF6152)
MRTRLVIFPVTAVVLLLSLTGATYAHHGFVSWFDMSRSVTVKGTVTNFDWTNPHAYIYFDVKDEQGAIVKWSAELGALAMLARAGWKRDTVKPGDEITAIGNPSKDGKPIMHLDKIVFANGQELSSAL